MPTTARVSIQNLPPAQAEALLARNHVGRLAYAFHDRVDIEPIHYVYDDGWIVGRTSPGSKLATLTHHRWVAFEVDEAKGLFDWSSVVVHGAVYLLHPDGNAADHQTYEHAVTLLRGLIPETFTESDPTPFRNIIVRIHIDDIVGRRAVPDAQ